MALLAIAELARRANVSRQAASKWAKDWGIPILSDDKGRRGVDDHHPDVAAYIANSSAQRRVAGRARASTDSSPPSKPAPRIDPGQPEAPPPAATAARGQTSVGRDQIPAGIELGGDSLRGRGGKKHNSGDGEGAPSRSDYQARKEKALAEKHELANRILRHEYVPILDLKLVFGRVYSVHTGIINPLGAKLAAQLAAEFGVTDPAKVLRAQEIIDGETYPALSSIKRELDAFLVQQRTRVVTEEEELALEADEE